MLFARLVSRKIVERDVDSYRDFLSCGQYTVSMSITSCKSRSMADGVAVQ